MDFSDMFKHRKSAQIGKKCSSLLAVQCVLHLSSSLVPSLTEIYFLWQVDWNPTDLFAVYIMTYANKTVPDWICRLLLADSETVYTD